MSAHPLTPDPRSLAEILDDLGTRRAELAKRISDDLRALHARERRPVSANDARRILEAYDDAPKGADLRFLSAVFNRAGWVVVDFDGRSDAPGNHKRRIARWRFDTDAATYERTAPTKAA